MALILPKKASEVTARSRVDVYRSLATGDPWLKNSWLGALTAAFSNRIFDFYFALEEAIKSARPDTAEDTELEAWGTIFGISRSAATPASGGIVITGTAASSVPSLTIFATSSGLEFKTQNSTTINNVSVSTVITNLGGGTGQAVVTAHGLASGVLITTSGSTDVEYNSTNVPITIIDADTFTYALSGDGVPATSPAPGVPLIAYAAAFVEVVSEEFGAAQDQLADSKLSLLSPISGVNDDAFANQGALAGGSDQETDENLKTRILERIQNPVAHFNVAKIVTTAKTINGVTRVFVEESTPLTGQVTVYFTRDGDVSAIPSGSEVAIVKAALVAIKPANIADADLIVAAPIAVPVNFTFTDLQPTSVAMKAAVTANLQQFFSERVSVSDAVVDADAYRSAIFSTVNSTNGESVTTFTLSNPPTPPGDVTVGNGRIATLGNVVFP